MGGGSIFLNILHPKIPIRNLKDSFLGVCIYQIFFRLSIVYQYILYFSNIQNIIRYSQYLYILSRAKDV